MANEEETSKRRDEVDGGSSSSSSDDDDKKSGSASSSKKRQKLETPQTTQDSDSNEIQLKLQELDQAYQEALQAYKADKSNKELRRQKTAAKQAWDQALLASAPSGSKAIVCRNCSQYFIFTAENIETFQDKGWVLPVQCKSCAKHIGVRRSKDRTTVDQRQNMCYEFQKTGECSRGDRCKFSHVTNHVGKAKQAGLLRKVCKYFEQGETCPHGAKCRFQHAAIKS